MKPSIVFMGTPDFAVAILDRLCQQGYRVVAVITAPDKPAGRGRKLNQSAVKKYAIAHGLPVMQPTNLKSESFLQALASYEADLQVVVAFRMLPKVVWSMPRLGTFNLHASLLPDYRGAAPIHWAIINGESKSGVTTFFIDDKIDTGEIILSREVDIAPDQTVGQLHDTLMELGADLVCETVDKIAEGNVSTVKQPEIETKPAPKLTSENTRINWHETSDQVYNKIRGLNPFPAAWTQIVSPQQTITAKLYGVEKIPTSQSLDPGTLIIDKNTLHIAAKDGLIKVLEIKLAGKKKMESKSLLNGFQFDSDSKAL